MHIRPKDYEYRFKKWALRQKLHERELRSILGQLSSRKQAGRPSEIVVSGIKWPVSKILGRLDRHRRSCLPIGKLFEPRSFVMRLADWVFILEQMDTDELPDFLARVQTPSPLMSDLPEWPEELPWLQFNKLFCPGRYIVGGFLL